MLLELLLSIVMVLLLYQRWLNKDVYKLGKQLNSGLWTLPFLGHTYLFIGNGHTLMKTVQIFGRDAIRHENGLTSCWIGNNLYTIIADPGSAEVVLKTCLNKHDVMQLLKCFIGNSILIAPVPIWRARRKFLVPVFSSKKLKHVMTILARESDILVQNMGKMAGSGLLYAMKYYTAYTIDAIVDSTLGYKLGTQNDAKHPFLETIDMGLTSISERMCKPWLHSDLVYHNLPLSSRLVKQKKYVDDLMTEVIENKVKEMEENYISQEHYENSSDDNSKTFLETLIRLPGQEKGLSKDEIREELLVLIVAGTDTSAVGTSFTSLMLARHPEVQEKVYEELQEVFGDSDRPPTFDDVARLKYLDAVIKETLRLYPAVPVIIRKVEKDVLLPCGIKLVAGTGAAVNIWALHRNPRYWGDDAELFRPERFIDTPLTHPAAFMPFSHGPRNCLGYPYAMMSMKTVLSTVLRRYRILPATAPKRNSEYPPIRLKFGIMMKDEEDCPIRLELRC